MVQQSIFGRIGQLVRANINQAIDSAEDPRAMLDQLVRDYTGNIAEAEDAVATTIGNLRLAEEDAAEAEQTALDWGAKAAAAATKAGELRGSAQTADADRFDNLARIALKRQIDAEQQAAALTPSIARQREVVAALKSGLDGMHGKLAELQAKRNELVARAKLAQAQGRVQDAVARIDILDPTSEVSRFEDKIRREEARVMGHAELQASSLDAQFEALDDAADDAEVEARLAALQAKPKGALEA